MKKSGKNEERLFDCCGILHLDVNILLEAKQEDLKEWRDFILSELEGYMWLKRNVSPHENNVNSRATPVYLKFIPVQFISVKKIPVPKIGFGSFRP